MATQAFFCGILSAISLPLGALLGLIWRPGSRISNDEIIFHAGDRAQELHFIRRGKVNIVAHRDGGEEIIASLHANDTFGEMSVLAGNSERRFDARAVGDVDLYTLEEDDLQRALLELPQLKTAVQTLAATRNEERSNNGAEKEWIDEAVAASIFPPEPEGVVFFIKLAIEALAAGAMLTMIAETMLPEAFEEGDSIIGIATLCGFLTALSVASI